MDLICEALSCIQADTNGDKKMIRFPRDPDELFKKKPLSILNTLSLLSQSEAVISDQTQALIIENCFLLSNVSPIELRDELEKILSGENVTEVLLRYREVIAQLIPEIRPCFDFDQHSHYHKYDVYEHIARAVSAAPATLPDVRRAMLFHDIGKPPMFTLDEKGEGHFKGHAKVSAEMAVKIMKRLKYDNDTVKLTAAIIAHHSDKIRSEDQLRSLVSRLGGNTFLLLIEAKKADNLAKHKFVLSENDEFDRLAEIAKMYISDTGTISCLS